MWRLFGADPFDRLFRLGALFDGPRGRSGALSPQMDVEEDDEAYEVTLELPGLKQEDLHVDLNQNVLTIQGEKRERRSSNGGDEEDQEPAGRSRRRSHWSERSYGRFSRSFALPPDADVSGLAASYADGLLTITIPKAEQSRPRNIEIRTGPSDGH
jgi:HSP20 family protein